MKCDNVQNSILNYIEKKLSKEEVIEFEAHINSCENCNTELEEMQQFLSVSFDNTKEHPSENLRKNFEQMLAEEKRNLETTVVKLNHKTEWKSYLYVAASIALIVSAFFLGKYQTLSPNNTITTTSHQQKVKEEKLLLALIENQSASRRIQAVNSSEKFSATDTKIIQALINRLFYDENTNVRLAAAEALSKFSSLEMVKLALIKSLKTEEDSSIQIELIEILAKIQEKRALEPMRKLLNNKDVPNYVKQELQHTISSLL